MPEIRQERPDDVEAISDVVREAFGREFEATVVQRLRSSKGFAPELSLVAIEDGSVVGHVMVTKLDIAADDGTTIPTTILAPLAVAPSHQNRGIGRALTAAVLGAARAGGHRSMILVGHPAYYPRLGFKPASTWGVRLSMPVPDDVFMAIELVPGALGSARGVVTLPSAFDESDRELGE